MEDENSEKLGQIFFSRALGEVDRVQKSGIRFAHYCSGESALAILDSKRMFLRNSVLMNDFSEVEYGANCLSAAYGGKAGHRLKAILADIDAELPNAIEAAHNALLGDVKLETYLLSISEHLKGKEDRYGRLSMWRAYAPENGAALIFNNGPFLRDSQALRCYTAPVLYVEPDAFEHEFSLLVDSLDRERDFLRAMPPGEVLDWLLYTFRMFLQTTKHPSFEEEREWRVLYSPSLIHRLGEMTDVQLSRVPTEIRCINRVPQRVFAIPFQDHREEGFYGATLPDVLEKVLIGPTRDGYAIAQALVAKMDEAGVHDAATKIQLTGIPLRN